MPITVTPEAPEAEAPTDTDSPTGDCIACDGFGQVCAACLRPRDHCECEMGCSGELVDCGECDGKGEKIHAPAVEDSPAVIAEPVAVAHDHQILAEIDAQERKVYEAEMALNEAKEHAKECREAFDFQVAELRRIIRNARPQEMPLFDQPPAASVESNGKHSPAPANDAWRSTCIDALQEFGVSESLIEKLRGKSLETLGDLADFQAKHGEFWAKEIKGLGPTKAAKVADGQAAFWAKHHEFCESSAA